MRPVRRRIETDFPTHTCPWRFSGRLARVPC